MATAVCNLVYDKPKRHRPTASILSQMGLRDKLAFVSTSGPIYPGNVGPCVPLCVLGRRPGYFGFIAKCRSRSAPEPYDLPFQAWWEEPVLRTPEERTISRGELVLTFRDQDGGSHYDAEITNQVYREFANGQASGDMRVRTGNGPPQPLMGGHIETMRQIGWEMAETFKRARIAWEITRGFMVARDRTIETHS